MNKRLSKFLSLLVILAFIGCVDRSSNSYLNELNKNESKVKSSIKDWIIKYAKYPESYQELGFNNFSVQYSGHNNRPVAQSETYQIMHRYSLLDVDSVLMNVNHYFNLDYEFFTIIVSKKNSNIFYKIPPDWHAFTERFGRELSAIDSLELEAKVSKMQRENDRINYTREVKSYDISDDEKEIEILRERIKKNIPELDSLLPEQKD